MGGEDEAGVFAAGDLGELLEQRPGPVQAVRVGRGQLLGHGGDLAALALETARAQIQQGLGLGSEDPGRLAVAPLTLEPALAPGAEGSIEQGDRLVGGALLAAGVDPAQSDAALVIPDPDEGAGVEAAQLGLGPARNERSGPAYSHRYEGETRCELPGPALIASEGVVELGEQRAHVGPACFGLIREAAEDRGMQAPGHRRRHGERRERLVGDRYRELGQAPTREGPLTKQGLERDDAEAKLVARGVTGQASELLWRHVGGRAHHRARARQLVQIRRREFDGLVGQGSRARLLRAGRRARHRARRLPCRDLARLRGMADQAKVEHARTPVCADDHVVGLEVSVHEASGVGSLEPGSNLAQHRYRFTPALAQIEGRLGSKPLTQGLTDHEFHGHEGGPMVFAELVDLDDIGVRQAREGLTFSLEAPAPGLALEARAEQLDRDLAVELLVVAGIDDPHAAAAELAQDHEATEAMELGGPCGVLSGEDRRQPGKGPRFDGRGELGFVAPARGRIEGRVFILRVHGGAAPG